MCSVKLTRFFDVIIAAAGLVLLFPLLAVVFILVYTETRMPFFLQERVGVKKSVFKLVKFRSMYPATESLPSHLVDPAAVTPIGGFLRRTKLDELPQLWNVIKGDMSLVGPRPNLQSQIELIQAREILGVYDVRPGITGLAQIQKIDMSTPLLLAKTDAEMIKDMSMGTYFRYILKTVVGSGIGDAVRRG